MPGKEPPAVDASWTSGGLTFEQLGELDADLVGAAWLELPGRLPRRLPRGQRAVGFAESAQRPAELDQPAALTGRIVDPPGEADQGAALLAYEDKLLDLLEPWDTGGRLLNFLIGDVSPYLFRDAWNPADYERPVDLKTTYDPRNLFWSNVDITSRAG